jgi:hypothetical protein
MFSRAWSLAGPGKAARRNWIAKPTMPEMWGRWIPHLAQYQTVRTSAAPRNRSQLQPAPAYIVGGFCLR